MPESLPLLSRQHEERLRQATEARELQEEQQRWSALTDEYHTEIRAAADVVGRKTVAIALGVDLSTVSNWLSCESGRGFPPPRLLLFLRKKVPALAEWERRHAETLIDDAQAIAELERDLLPDLGKRDQERMRTIIRRIRKGTP